MAYTRHEPYGVVVSSHSGWLQGNRHGTFATCRVQLRLGTSLL